MWRDYFGSVGTIFAVVNGLIAITIALLPMRRSVYKLRLGALALVLGGLAVGAAFYTTYRSYAQTERQQTDRAEIHLRLSSLHRRRPRAARPDPGRQARDADRRRGPVGAARRNLSARPGRRALRHALPRQRERALRRRRRGYRSAVGLLARGAQPHRQSGSDQRRVSRAAVAAACARANKRAAQRPPFYLACL